MQDLAFIINLILIIVCASIGTFFLALPIPKQTYLNNYRISIKILAVAYLIMSILNTVLIFINKNSYTPEYFNFITLLLSSLQALLFAFTLITLFNPLYINRKIIIRNCLPICFFSLSYLILLLFFDDYKIISTSDLASNFYRPIVIVKFLFFIFYCVQLTFLVRTFFKEENKYLKKIENYFSEPGKVRMKRVRFSFLFALVIGILALIYQIFPSQIFESIFTFINTCFYFIFAINYINYNKIYFSIEPIIENQFTDIKSENASSRIKLNWEDYKNTIIKEKYFLIEGVTLEEMAQKLKIGRTTLSNLINNEECVNFNSWVNKLRIEEAKNIIKTNPEYTIQRVAELTGFSEHSNFSRQFKNFTGTTPNQWRKEFSNNF